MKTRYLEAMLILMSVLVSAVLAESVYRSWLHYRYPENVRQSFYVYDKVNVQLDQEFGFSYIPDSDAIYINVVNGAVASLVDMRANSLGNMGREPVAYATADLRILVFGDSFTSIGHDGLTWTDLLQDKLSEKLSRSVAVVNFGRDGYGILQMFDLAAAQVARFEPDLVIFAFITDDMTRARSWWMSDPAQTRLFRFESPPIRADLQYAQEEGVDAALIDERATKQWFEEMRRRPNAADPVLGSLLAKRTQLEKDKASPGRDFLSLTTSYLYNRIAHGNAFGPSSEAAGRTRFRMELRDFGADQRFDQALKSLQALGAPYVLVHFPIHDELQAQQYELNEQQKALLESLARMTGKQPISLLEYPTGVDDNRDLFMLPDNHASAAGLNFYADAVSAALIQANLR